ncbi:MAG: glutamate--tRNA ligase [Candidatus Lindowbacteria bacterium]|nr:glutamate--tRNA ligase [Candidatus Lindowbacteria bacterium]
MTTDTVVTRFAPSPTGFLHVGGARTALYSWAYARKNNGKFILRIEDTDQERSDPKMTDQIMDSLKWLGIDWDEGPFFQSERRDIYDGLFEKLLAASEVYECFCTPEELEANRSKEVSSGGGAYKYAGTCSNLSPDELAKKKATGAASVLRLRLPQESATVVDDLLRGKVRFESDVMDDIIIRKSGGMPTFHFAVAVDDALMGVNFVIRGDDHLSNTPKQIQVLHALKRATGDETFTPPRYVHLSMILGSDGKRFSKRHGATAVGDYRQRGFLPQAITNYLSLLGWSPGDDLELFDKDFLSSNFSFERISKSGAVFDEQKLEWMNGKYLAEIPSKEIVELLKSELDEFGIDKSTLESWGIDLEPEVFFDEVMALARDRSRLLSECVEQVRYFLVPDIEIDPAPAKKHLRGLRLVERMEIAIQAVESAQPWSVSALEEQIRTRAEAVDIKPPKVMHLIRVAVTGRSASPSLFETVYYVGRKRAIERLQAALQQIKERPTDS